VKKTLKKLGGGTDEASGPLAQGAANAYYNRYIRGKYK